MRTILEVGSKASGGWEWPCGSQDRLADAQAKGKEGHFVVSALAIISNRASSNCVYTIPYFMSCFNSFNWMLVSPEGLTYPMEIRRTAASRADVYPAACFIGFMLSSWRSVLRHSWPGTMMKYCSFWWYCPTLTFLSTNIPQVIYSKFYVSISMSNVPLCFLRNIFTSYVCITIAHPL